jgi:hypothetical protein
VCIILTWICVFCIKILYGIWIFVEILDLMLKGCMISIFQLYGEDGV